MTFVPAGIAALVTAYCIGCATRPGWRDPEGSVDVDAGHAVMGATTLLMVLGLLPGAWTPALLVLFGGSVVGCGINSVRQVARRRGYLRLAVLHAAMLPMLVPASVTAAPAMSRSAASGGPAGSAHHLMSAAADTAMPSTSSPGRAIDLLLIAALLVLTAERLTGSSRPGQGVHCRLHTLCEVAMAATMGCLLAAML